MCTLILGRDVVAPGTVLLAANRDESPARPSAPPGVLRESPRLVGGRDLQAGGSWLVVRDARAVTAILNRRDRSGEPAPPAPGRPSRGTLVLEVAALDGTPAALPDAALERALAAAAGHRYAPCTIVFATPESAWAVAIEGGAPPRVDTVTPGWHVLTHADLDDPSEPRTVRLMRELQGFAPRDRDQAERRLAGLLRSHDAPAVCLHEGRMMTVSSSIVWLAAGEAAYRHAEGRPCEQPFTDRTALLAARSPARE
jgi:uncharacterized protein with NRDE domain